MVSDKTRGKGSGFVGQIIPEFNASVLVGLKVLVVNAASITRDDDGEEVVSIPNLRGLQTAAAVSRCLMPIKLRGSELRAMRKIMRLTLAGLADRLDAKTAPETISRWESEAQPMGGFAEKVMRLLVCDALHKEASGVSYDSSKIAQLRVLDPWLANKKFEVPFIRFQCVKLKEQSGDVIDVWDERKEAA